MAKLIELAIDRRFPEEKKHQRSNRQRSPSQSPSESRSRSPQRRKNKKHKPSSSSERCSSPYRQEKTEAPSKKTFQKVFYVHRSPSSSPNTSPTLPLRRSLSSEKMHTTRVLKLHPSNPFAPAHQAKPDNQDLRRAAEKWELRDRKKEENYTTPPNLKVRRSPPRESPRRISTSRSVRNQLFKQNTEHDRRSQHRYTGYDKTTDRRGSRRPSQEDNREQQHARGRDYRTRRN